MESSETNLARINRTQRNIASRVLRSFIDGAITNDEFDAKFPRDKEDAALYSIYVKVWMLYCDLRCHKLTGKYAPNAESRAMLERCVLFLNTDLAFEWPISDISLLNIGRNLWSWIKGWLGMKGSQNALVRQAGSDDNDDVWPFFRRTDYELYAGADEKD